MLTYQDQFDFRNFVEEHIFIHSIILKVSGHFSAMEIQYYTAFIDKYIYIYLFFELLRLEQSEESSHITKNIRVYMQVCV